MLYSFLTGDACTIVLAAAEGADRLKNIGNVPCGAHLHYTAQLVLTSLLAVGSPQFQFLDSLSIHGAVAKAHSNL